MISQRAAERKRVKENERETEGESERDPILSQLCTLGWFFFCVALGLTSEITNKRHATTSKIHSNNNRKKNEKNNAKYLYINKMDVYTSEF